jgi:RHS repeat-associated protein
MSLSMSSHAQTGNLTITRTPSTMIAGQPFTISWSSTEPTAVATKYSCVSPAGGFAGSATLTVSGSASGTADPNWLWKDSTCTWTVVNAAGSVLASRTDIMKTVAAPVNGVTYIHTDGLGSPVAKSGANGNLIAGSRTRYEPYGMAVAGTATPTIGFTGHVNDADTGLTYMQQRYYDPVAGRFLSTDPVLTDYNTGASFNRYTYANNNPYKYVDPDGRLPIFLLVPLIIKGVDMAITAAEVYSAAQTGGASAAGIAIAKNAAMNAIPGAKIASKLSSVYTGSKLAKNMASAGRGVEKGKEEAHHIVAQADKRAAGSRDILDRNKIDVHSADNGAAMAKQDHHGIHTTKYHENIKERLTEAESRGTCVFSCQREVKNELQKIGKELEK